MRVFPVLLKEKFIFLFELTLFLALAGYVFYEPISTIVSAWRKEEYSYAYLVPPLALLLGLHRLSKSPVRPEPSWLGLGVVLIGLFFHLLGLLSGVTVFPQYGFFIALLGTALTLLGWAGFVRLFPVLAYLFFTIPLPTTFYITLSAKLQLLSSMFGTDVLQLLGYSAYQEGNIIDLGAYKLQVVEACSGLRYIFPLLGFSYLIAYLFKDAFWKRCIVFVSALPLATLLNVLRIVVIGITVNIWGPKAAEGILHDFEGWVVFSLCVLLLFGEVLLLRLVGATKGKLDLDSISVPHGPYFTKPFAFNGALAVALVLFLGTGAGMASGKLAPHVEMIPSRTAFSSFPMVIGGWHGVSQNLTESEINLLKLSDYINASYVKGGTQVINLFIAYYGSQRNKNDLHSPEMCLPGSGWQALSTSTYLMPLTPEGRGIYVTRTLVQKGLERQIVYYWFEQAGENMASRLAIKLRTITNSLVTGRTDSALLRLTTPILSQETEQDADNRLQSFFVQTVSILPTFIPNFKPD